MIGQISLLFTYVGEFQPIIYRKRILSLMDLGLVVGMFLVPRKSIKILHLTKSFSIHWNKMIIFFRFNSLHYCSISMNRNKIFSNILIILFYLILISVLGWGIIPLTFEYNKTFFHFRSWNLFLLISSLPAQFIGFWLIFFPETPKYLAETEQDLELINVLINVYKVNTGKSTESYFVSKIY